MKIGSYLFTLAVGLVIGWKFGDSNLISSAASNEVVQGSPAKSCDEPKATQCLAPSKSTEKQNTLSQSTPTPKDQLVKLKENFWGALNKDNFSGAQDIANQINVLAPNSEDYYESLTKVFIRTRELDKAKPLLQKCLELYPTSRSCLTDMADAELELGTKEDQLKAVENCLRVVPNYPSCSNDLGIYYMHDGNFEAAIQTYQNLMHSNGSYGFRFYPGLLHAQLGYAYEGAGKLAEAAEQFNEACKVGFESACKHYDDLRRKL